MKYYDGQLGNKIDISHNYDLNNKKVVLQQISPYRTDFYISPAGKYKMVTIRYSNVFFKKSINKYIIDSNSFIFKFNQNNIEKYMIKHGFESVKDMVGIVK